MRRLARALLGSVSGGIAPEASYDIHIPQVYAPQMRWTSPVTNRLFLEAGFSQHYMHWRHQYNPSVGPFDVAHSEATTGYLTVATNSRYDNLSNQYNVIGSVSYVTGSHNFKAGFVHRQGYMEEFRALQRRHVAALTFVNGEPNSVTVLNTPDARARQPELRLRHLRTGPLDAQPDDGQPGRPLRPLQRLDRAVRAPPAGRFVPARSFGAIENMPNWNDWAIRTGVSYDLFGDGRTAIKANVSKYVAGESLSSTTPYNPMALKSESRSWTDRGRQPLAAGRVRQRAVRRDRADAQRQLRPRHRHDAPRRRPSARLQLGRERRRAARAHRPGSAVSVGYYWRQYHNLTWTDNLLVNPDTDYTPFTIVGPVDPRLPNGGGEVITMYNLNQNKLGLVDNVVKINATRRSDYGGLEITAQRPAEERRVLPGRADVGANATRSTATSTTPTRAASATTSGRSARCGRRRARIRCRTAWPLSGVWRILPGASLGATLHRHQRDRRRAAHRRRHR